MLPDSLCGGGILGSGRKLGGGIFFPFGTIPDFDSQSCGSCPYHPQIPGLRARDNLMWLRFFSYLLVTTVVSFGLPFAGNEATENSPERNDSARSPYEK